MILDKQCQLSDAQAFSADAASTNSYDSGAAGNEIASGEPLAMVLCVSVAADHTTGDETYEFQTIQSANSDLSSPDILASRTILYSDLTAGSIHVLPIPAGAKTKRYLGMYFNGGGTTPTVTASVYILPLSSVQKYKAYPNGYTIS